MKTEKFRVGHHQKLKLSDLDTSNTLGYSSKEEAQEKLKSNIEEMSELQDLLYALDKYSLLIVFQAMDAAGKDSTIKHVMSGLNPQGTQVYSFKQPSAEELDHGYLWRIQKAVPERGRIGIFNRSHYEEVLVVKVHDLIKNQNIPDELKTDKIWEKRYDQINSFEKYLYENGTRILKFFLHISKEEQAKRFLARLDDPSKNWKFSAGDLEERKLWDQYMEAYQEALKNTSTDYSPWYVIPADKKWFARLAVSEIIVETLKSLKMKYPELDEVQKSKIEQYKNQLKIE